MWAWICTWAHESMPVWAYYSDKEREWELKRVKICERVSEWVSKEVSEWIDDWVSAWVNGWVSERMNS